MNIGAQLMRAGNEENYFAYEVDRYACVYMAKLNDLLELSPRTYSGAPRRPFGSRNYLSFSRVNRKINSSRPNWSNNPHKFGMKVLCNLPEPFESDNIEGPRFAQIFFTRVASNGRVRFFGSISRKASKDQTSNLIRISFVDRLPGQIEKT